MTIRTIGLVVFDSAEADWVINGAAMLALAFEAHLIAMHPFKQVVSDEGIGYPPILFAKYLAWKDDESQKIRAKVEDRACRDGLHVEFRQQDAQIGREQFLLGAARATDLVILGGNGGKSRTPDDESLVERLIRNLGRPALILPPEGCLCRPAEQLTIGWSETREAVRAAHDALELAAPGARIDLVSLLARASDDFQSIDSREDFAAALGRRGFKAALADRMSAVENRGEELLRAAKEKNADIVVAGAFGHSQFYDFMVGAVTSYLLKAATLPVLLSR